MVDPESSTDCNHIAAVPLSVALNPQGVISASTGQVCIAGSNVKCCLGSESEGTVEGQAPASPAAVHSVT